MLGDRQGEVGLVVKAGLHEVDMVKRRMQPCYWPGTTHRVIRGSWYVDKGSGYAPLKVCTFHACSWLLYYTSYTARTKPNNDLADWHLHQLPMHAIGDPKLCVD